MCTAVEKEEDNGKRDETNQHQPLPHMWCGFVLVAPQDRLASRKFQPVLSLSNRPQFDMVQELGSLGICKI
jgi:hypothetical protein